MKCIIKITYLGMVFGFIFSLILGHSLWLEMRVNTSLALPFFSLVGIGAGFLRIEDIPASLVLITQGIMVCLFSYIHGFDVMAWTIVPAALFRDGFFLNVISLLVINKILLCLIVLGNLSLVPFSKSFKLNIFKNG